MAAQVPEWFKAQLTEGQKIVACQRKPGNVIEVYVPIVAKTLTLTTQEAREQLQPLRHGPHLIPTKPFDLEAEVITPEQIEAAHQGLRLLADDDPDRAAERNGVGFSKLDGEVGHSLAARESLSRRQGALARRLCRKYRRQLPSDLLNVLLIEEK